jgi:hypothetical protein
MIASLFQTAVAGIVAVLATSSASNMLQTSRLLQQYQQLQQEQQQKKHDNMDSTRICPSTAAQLKRYYSSLPTKDVVRELQLTKRENLLSLFLSCEAPIVDDIVGEWNGILLDNNHWIMVCLSHYMEPNT